MQESAIAWIDGVRREYRELPDLPTPTQRARSALEEEAVA